MNQKGFLSQCLQNKVETLSFLEFSSDLGLHESTKSGTRLDFIDFAQPTYFNPQGHYLHIMATQSSLRRALGELPLLFWGGGPSSMLLWKVQPVFGGFNLLASRGCPTNGLNEWRMMSLLLYISSNSSIGHIVDTQEMNDEESKSHSQNAAWKPGRDLHFFPLVILQN